MRKPFSLLTSAPGHGNECATTDSESAEPVVPAKFITGLRTKYLARLGTLGWHLRKGVGYRHSRIGNGMERETIHLGKRLSMTLRLTTARSIMLHGLMLL